MNWNRLDSRMLTKRYFERPNFISRPKRKLVENNDDNHHHHHPHQRANIVTGSPGLLCANNWSRSLHSCRNWKAVDEGKFVMKSAYTRLKVPRFVLQTVGVGQERLCKGRDGGIQFMQLLDVRPAFVLFCQNWLIWWRTGLLEHTVRRSTYLQYSKNPQERTYIFQG